MNNLLLFGILSIPVFFFSWHTMFDIKSHGFYRFISWECIVWLITYNYKFWFDNPLSFQQIISWFLLIISAFLVIVGVVLMKKIGKPKKTREEKTLFEFEKTSELVDQGIFKYIRHPLYSSLLFLTWGIFFKNINITLLIFSLCSTIFLFLTALADEKECIIYFGDKYKEYMKRSKRFIPYIL